MAIINHKIVLTIEEDWIETGDGKGNIIRRIQTPEEHNEMYCECCTENTTDFEVTIKNFAQIEDFLILCKKCTEILSSTILNDEHLSYITINRI